MSGGFSVSCAAVEDAQPLAAHLTRTREAVGLVTYVNPEPDHPPTQAPAGQLRADHQGVSRLQAADLGPVDTERATRLCGLPVESAESTELPTPATTLGPLDRHAKQTACVSPGEVQVQPTMRGGQSRGGRWTTLDSRRLVSQAPHSTTAVPTHCSGRMTSERNTMPSTMATTGMK